MIGYWLTGVLLLFLFGVRSKMRSAREAFHRFMLGEEADSTPPLWRKGLNRLFPYAPARNFPLLAGTFGIPLVIGSLLGVFNYSVLWLAAGSIVALAAPWLVYNLLAARWRRRCRLQMIETLRTLATTLRAGRTFTTAIGRAASEAASPLSDLLDQVEKEIRVGVPEGDAFQRLVEQTGVSSLEPIAMLVSLTLIKGGNLAYVLDDFATALEEEEELLADLRGETASYRLSAYGLPVLLIGLLFMFHSTITPLLAQTGFLLLFIISLFFIGVGLLLTFGIVRKLEV